MHDRPLRVFVAGIAHETNSFSPLPTSLRAFEDDICYCPPATKGRDAALAFAGYGDAIAVARAAGDEVVEGPCFWTQPSGPVSAALYTRLSGEILNALHAAGPVDMVMLNLHGAMMAQGVDDAEGDLLAKVRNLVGPGLPIGALLDLHGNMSAAMVESGAILIGVKEYPHIDYRARAVDLHAALVRMARSGTTFATTLRTIPLLSLQGTTEEPMRSLVQDLYRIEARDDVCSVTLMHGFPWADAEHAGASVLIVSQAADLVAMDRIADEIADRFTAAITGSPVSRLKAADAVSAALAIDANRGPVVIADSSDNPGGGSACDSTFLLRELLDRNCADAAIGMIWDPQAAQIAADAGVGARLHLRIGGKTGRLSGDPVDVEVEVLAVRTDARQRFFADQPNSPLGLAVSLRAGGVDIILNSLRQQVFAPECFTELGVDLAAKALVVVKSSQHFRAHFDPIASAILYCNAPGSMSTDLGAMPYRHLSITPCAGGFSVDRPVRWAYWPERMP